MLANLNGWHLVIVLVVVLLLFGATKLPALARSAGQSARIFKGEMKAMKNADAPAEPLAQDDPVTEAFGANATAAETTR